MAELTTLAVVKALMGLKTPDADAKINALIPIVSRLAQSYCGREFFNQSFTEWHDGDGGEDILLNQYPLASDSEPVITEFTYPSDTIGNTVDASSYFVDKKNGILHMNGGWPRGFNRYKVVYSAGLGADYSAINASYPDLTGAVAMWISQAFQANPDAIATEEGANEYSIHMLSVRLPMASVKEVLDLYRRPQL